VPAPGVPQTSYQTFVSGGYNREYFIQVPGAHDGVTPVPLVLLFHGHGFTKAQVSYLAWLTRFDTLANSENFILVYPVGLPDPAGKLWWNAWRVPAYADDVDFADDLLDRLESQYCIDQSRIYSTGWSNGAIESVALACNLSDRIAAIGAMAGIYYPPWSTVLVPLETCPDTHPVPVIAFVGSEDTYMPMDGSSGTGTIVGRRNIETEVMPDWADHNGCSATPAMSYPVAGIRLAEYPGCAGGATTLLYVCEHADGSPTGAGCGHHWMDSRIDPPGDPPFGQNTHLLHATELMWDFFEAHPLVGSPPPPPPPMPPETVSQPVSPGGSATTDNESDGATADDPIESTVTSPQGGALSITESVGMGAPPGYMLLGNQVQISAPPATAGSPLVITFLVDASALLPGAGAADVVVFRNGVPLPGCTGAPGTASPDPCVASRQSLSGGDVSITALTSAASLWTLAVQQAQEPGEDFVLSDVAPVGGIVDIVSTLKDPARPGPWSTVAIALSGIVALLLSAGAGVQLLRRRR
jgi:polyhydroxybutyrate depolymerase